MSLHPLLNTHSNFSLSPKRRKALDRCDEELFKVFETLTASINPELKDAIHYVLFKVKDRFSMSATWMICDELGLDSKQYGPLLCAIELNRCATSSVVSRFFKNPKKETVYVEPARILDALFCIQQMSMLIPFDTTLTTTLREQERSQVVEILLKKTSGLNILSDFYEQPMVPDSLAGPAFFTSNGALIDIISRSTQHEYEELLSRIGVLTQEIHEYLEQINERQSFTSTSSQLDRIKTIETEVLKHATKLRVPKSVTDLLITLLEPSQAQLQ